MTCRMSLKSGAVGSEQNKINDGKGCGGIMRVAPCALIMHNAFSFLSADEQAKLAFKLGCVSYAITHTHPSGWLSAGSQASILSRILSGELLETAVAQTISLLEGELHKEETMFQIERTQELSRDFLEACEHGPNDVQKCNGQIFPDLKQALALQHIEELGRGFTGEEALGIALYCSLVIKGDTETAICYAVNHGGDSYSTGAVTGNITGALCGECAIPGRWTAHLDLADLIRDVSKDLLNVLNALQQQRMHREYPAVVTVYQKEEFYKNKNNLALTLTI